MKTPKHVLAISSLLLATFMAGCASAAADTAPAATQPAVSALDRILDGLDARGRSLETLVADVGKSERDEALGEDNETRTGRVMYQQLPDGEIRIRASFDKVITGERTREERVEYLLDRGVLTDRTYRSRVEVRRIVHRPGQKINLFKLGQGPFPLPIGQARADVYAEFDVKLIPPADGDPAGTAHIQLIPRPETQLARKFHSIDVWVDPKDYMPRRIETLDVRQTTRTVTELSNVQINIPLGDERFELEKIDENRWQISEEGLD